jgi:hypothetical protein
MIKSFSHEFATADNIIAPEFAIAEIFLIRVKNEGRYKTMVPRQNALRYGR